MIKHPENRFIMQPLFEYLEQFHPLSKEFISEYEKNCILIDITKNKFILSPIDNNNAIYFLLKGIVRGFVKEGKKDITTVFGFENEFIRAVHHPIQQSNYSPEYLQAVEDCKLIRISHQLINFLSTNYPEGNLISRKLLELHYHAASERSLLARIPTALGRYNKFKNSQRDIGRIPQRFLASYLGMRLETLSRMKNKNLSLEILNSA